MEFVTEFYRPFLRFLFGTGLRWSEATALRAEHIDRTWTTLSTSRMSAAAQLNS